jgi:DNA-binding PadR family transcriptional regulator
MSQDLPATSYALLGLLTFGDDLTGYELKQRADRTLRYYWVSPAMSQVYSELDRLTAHGFVRARDAGPNKRSTKYRITARGRSELTRWMKEEPAGFPVLKHPVALRLLIGHLVEPEVTVVMLRRHLAALEEHREGLRQVRESLHGRDEPDQAFHYPSLVADWGLEYLDGERAIIEKLLARLDEES